MSLFALLSLACTVDTVPGERQGLEARLADVLVTLLTPAKGPEPDAIERIADLGERLLLVFHEAEGELLLEGVGAQVGHVNRRVGEIAAGLAPLRPQRLVLQMRDVPVEPVPQGEQLVAKRF